MDENANLIVYYNGEVIRDSSDGVSFRCPFPFYYHVPSTKTFDELKSGLYQSIEAHILKRVQSVLYQISVNIFRGYIQFDTMPVVNEVSMRQMFQCYHQNRAHVSSIELYVEFEQVVVDAVEDVSYSDVERQTVLEELGSGSEKDFEANYEVSGEEEEGDKVVDVAVQNTRNPLASQHPLGVPSSVVAPEDGEFMIGMEYVSKKAVVFAVRKYTIDRGVDYTVWEYELQTFYAKCKLYGNGCD
ncbi:hypothetical protein PIB30_046850 [Stylosanthes scabra]|uniref:Transposase MuDR plant domain-containing protein n=1 Tax=Stylosanthes scabra TaxID=79078 RepID=A0ABU6XFM4_9FABA|nr:hypothetical protein [Stylosanthes scabra]